MLALIPAWVDGDFNLGRGKLGGEGSGMFGRLSVVPTFLTLVSTVSLLV